MRAFLCLSSLLLCSGLQVVAHYKSGDKILQCDSGAICVDAVSTLGGGNYDIFIDRLWSLRIVLTQTQGSLVAYYGDRANYARWGPYSISDLNWYECPDDPYPVGLRIECQSSNCQYKIIFYFSSDPDSEWKCPDRRPPTDQPFLQTTTGQVLVPVLSAVAYLALLYALWLWFGRVAKRKRQRLENERRVAREQKEAEEAERERVERVERVKREREREVELSIIASRQGRSPTRSNEVSAARSASADRTSGAARTSSAAARSSSAGPPTTRTSSAQKTPGLQKANRKLIRRIVKEGLDGTKEIIEEYEEQMQHIADIEQAIADGTIRDTTITYAANGSIESVVTPQSSGFNYSDVQQQQQQDQLYQQQQQQMQQQQQEQLYQQQMQQQQEQLYQQQQMQQQLLQQQQQEQMRQQQEQMRQQQEQMRQQQYQQQMYSPPTYFQQDWGGGGW